MAMMETVLPGFGFGLGSVVSVLLVTYLTFRVLRFLVACHSTEEKKLPPSPPGYPIVGNLLSLLGTNPHSALAELASTYKMPLMTVKLGHQYNFVISSPEIAKELLITSGSTFAYRGPPNFASRVLADFGSKAGHLRGILLVQFCHEWSVSRKLLTGVVNQYKKSGTTILEDEIQKAFALLEKDGAADEGTQLQEVSSKIWAVLGHNIVRFLYGSGCDYSSGRQEILKLNRDMLTCVVKGKLADFFPFLEPVLSYWYRNDVNRTMNAKFDLYEKLLAQRAQSEETVVQSDVYVEAMKSNIIDRCELLHILDETTLGAIETSGPVIEWGLLRLAHNPDMQERMREELDRVLGKGNLFTYENAETLPYVVAVVKEVLRLHMPIPLLVTHTNNQPAELGGYKFPKDSLFVVNIWAMAHDENVWKNPLFFNPDRFLETNKEFKGADCSFLVFGAGRRMCPGINMALPLIFTMIVQFVQKYEMTPEEGACLKTTEIYNSAVRMKNFPIKLRFKKRF